jgi:hypothetical protein
MSKQIKDIIALSDNKLTKFAAMKSRFGGQKLTLAMVQLIEAAPSLRLNIPRSALVATLDTYDFINYFKFATKK